MAFPSLHAMKDRTTRIMNQTTVNIRTGTPMIRKLSMKPARPMARPIQKVRMA